MPAKKKAKPKEQSKSKAKPASKPAASLPALVELANGGNAAAVKMIAKLATPEAYRALVELLFDADDEIREQASLALDRAGQKDPAVAELVVASCHARPESCDHAMVLDRLAELAINHQNLARDRRVLGLLRRQLVVKPTGVAVEELAAQESALAFLIGMKDRESMSAIVGLLDQPDRESLWFNICDAVDAMGAGQAELAKLRAAVTRANNDTEREALEKTIAKLAKRLKA